MPGNAENIIVTDRAWLSQLVRAPLHPRLAALPGSDTATFHRAVMPRFVELVAAWEAAGVLGDVVQWGGSYCARFIRGRPGRLSAHSWGSAFDLNAPHNPLGKTPPPAGVRGSVARLVPIAESLGWAWGGRFTRPDGMHFEWCGHRVSS